MIYVSFFAGPGYAEEASELRASLDQFSLTHDIRKRSDAGSWEKNCGQKPAAILDSLLCHQCPVIWLDADARVIRTPDLVLDDVDFAAHWRFGNELLSGTLYFGFTPAAGILLDRWQAKQRQMPFEMDQKTLQFALSEMKEPVRVRRLPVEYCAIFDGKDLPSKPIIMQTQASRKLRKRPT